MAVLDPIPLEVTNRDAGDTKTLEVDRFPGIETPEGEAATREVTFGSRIFIERDDFSEDPPEDWRRLAPGREVRLRGAWVFKCEDVEKDEEGRVVGLRGTIDADTLGRNPEDRKVTGTIHWISEEDAVRADVRLYDRLFSVANPEAAANGDADSDFTDHLNPDSLTVLTEALVPRDVLGLESGDAVQFERLGYFAPDPESTPAGPVFNRIVTLKDTWSKRGRVESLEATGDVGDIGGKADASVRRVIHQTDEDRVSDARSEARAADPVLAERFSRYRDELGLDLGDADVLSGNRAIGDLFEGALDEHADAADVAAWVVNEVRALLGGREAGEL
ncbi:MAG TPA: glutamine--tRNA ligase, partial [Myxococcota bacterium]|nr:glutamine--tRNA ligase [Myxococcota bacterium]